MWRDQTYCNYEDGLGATLADQFTTDLSPHVLGYSSSVIWSLTLAGHQQEPTLTLFVCSLFFFPGRRQNTGYPRHGRQLLGLWAGLRVSGCGLSRSSRRAAFPGNIGCVREHRSNHGVPRRASRWMTHGWRCPLLFFPRVSFSRGTLKYWYGLWIKCAVASSLFKWRSTVYFSNFYSKGIGCHFSGERFTHSRKR